MKQPKTKSKNQKNILIYLKPNFKLDKAQSASPLKKIATLIKQNLLLLVVILLVVILLASILSNKQDRYTYNFSSALMKTLDVDELSTSELIYNGVLEVNHKDSDNVHYRIRYDSKIKVGIKMSDIKFDVNPDDKTIAVLLPDVEILEVIIDPDSIKFLPDHFRTDMKTAVIDAKNDALMRSKETPALIKTAEENLKSIVTALTLPIIQDEGYQLVWQSEENEK